MNPKFVGIPCYTSEFWDIIDLCKKIKKNHKCTIIIGGLHTSIKPDDFFFDGSPVDMVVVGDGQYPLVEIITRLNSDDSLEGIEGVMLPSNAGESLTISSSHFAEWEKMPTPDYSQLNMNYYTQPHVGVIRNIVTAGIHIFTTIGCPFSCTFCANRNKKVRFRPISKVLDEIETLKNNYKIDSFYILDDTFLIKKSRTMEFVAGLKERKIDLIWAMETRVNLFDDEIAKLISGAGCIQVDFGIESGSQESLDRMKKGVKTEQIINAFDICRKHNLRTLANYMLNTPEETEADVEKTIAMIRETRPTRIGMCLTIPFPGTAIYDKYVNPPLTKEEYKIYSTKYLYVTIVDPRFKMIKHNLDIVSLRVKTTARANGIRNLIDYTFNPIYWRSLLKSKRKIQYLIAMTKGIALTVIEKISRLIVTYENILYDKKE